MAARSYDNASVFLAKHTLILIFNDGCADRGFFNVCKSQLFQSDAHRFDARTVIINDK